MITFKNDSRDLLFSEFFDSYNQYEQIKNNAGDFRIVFDIKDKMASCFYCDEPFASNSVIKAIWYNQSKADEFLLTKEERFACIAHELGHLLDAPRAEGEDQQDREKKADGFAVRLGLAEHLITALEKLKKGNDEVAIQERIELLGKIA